MRALRTVLAVAGALLLGYLIVRIGVQPIAQSLSRLAWWEFGLICVPYAVIAAVDTLAWRYAFARDRAPFLALFGARLAGDAVNLVTAVASVGGEAVKAWLIRRHVSYEESVPSLVIAKTTSVIGQGLFLLLGLLLAWAVLDVDAQLVRSMGWLLLVECLAIGGFVLAQVSGAIARVGRVVAALGSARGAEHAVRLEGSLRSFYRDHPARLLSSTAFHFLGWTLGGLEVLVILRVLDVPLSLATAVVIEAFGAAIRFAAFLVPAGLGVSEAANAGAFAALGAGAGAGLAFSFVRRARQVIWVGIGLLIALAMRSREVVAGGSAPAAR